MFLLLVQNSAVLVFHIRYGAVATILRYNYFMAVKTSSCKISFFNIILRNKAIRFNLVTVLGRLSYVCTHANHIFPKMRSNISYFVLCIPHSITIFKKLVDIRS